jgi:hypothetical protein
VGKVQSGFVIPDRIWTVHDLYLVIPAPFNDAFSRRLATPNKVGILLGIMSLKGRVMHFL